MATDKDAMFTFRGYGKNFVRVLHVTRTGNIHHVKELEVNTQLSLYSDKDYTHADNSDIIATDTQKNTVYALAKQNGITNIEEFAMQLAEHFLRNDSHVKRSHIYIEQVQWKRMADGKHIHAFVSCPEVTRTCRVIQHKNEKPLVTSGLKGFKIMKTTKSSFTNFHKDEYRSLPDMEDRIFCTVVDATWTYSSLRSLDFDWAWNTIKQCVEETFAGCPKEGSNSPSVQNTLYLTQKQVLAKVPQVDEMTIALPNVHAYPFDFSKLPQLNIKENNEVFVPYDKPSGNITAALKRRHISKL
ncbi:unnamed protein product [Owenia fusiformis]|uniref:Uricase n=1 Tax=Owenia fusiformis TaxID=6347 RepID=A0A8S4NZV5_OWEFU|nr:unnamed protein product [Owenia fusiformis]